MRRVPNIRAGLCLAAIAAVAAACAAAVTPTPSGNERVVKITAQRFKYEPEKVTLKRGEPVVLELSTLDRVHGFKVPAFGLRTDIKPGEVARVRIVPDKAGTYAFACDNFCGSGHEEMDGTIVVTE